ncbi:mandelate racemase/muconate lactonizing enzyme family protein [Asanoa iriomotensis]|uniref:Enolase n=1 Tax=Asanoa iriomotensis TaxID=234613 RepID=A0ABQ4BZ68_9ACTN|nr:mandelate racemase/muconate lactonizing enzyme family protein [Asanoa iriomotensis]GIF55814.1 enolase [Asanoa iriomotensis]
MPTIEAIETIPLRIPLRHHYKGSYYSMRNRCTIITRIRTSDGVVGEAYNADTDEEQHEVLGIIRDEIAPRIIGLDVLRVERVWQAMLPVTLDQLRDRAIPMQAIACVDSAVWDAVGKYANQPLWRLWGGYRDRIPMIGIGGYYGSSAADLEKELEFFKAEHGMVGMKFKIGAKPPQEDADRLRAARKIVGEDFLFVVDANQGYTVNEALEFLRLLGDDVRLRWFEEPTRWHADWRGLRDVRSRGNVDVAAGQSEISRVGMREMFVNGAVDVCNFDASWGGGPTEWRRVAAMALAFDVELGHHEEGQVAAHLLASVPNGTFVEAFSPTRDPIFWTLLANRPALVDGELPLPHGPGFGWELDEDVIRRHRADG